MKPQDAWNVAYNQLELQLGRASFNIWLRQTVFLGFEQGTHPDGIFVIGVPSSYARDMLQYRLQQRVQRVLAEITQTRPQVRFELHKPKADGADNPEEDAEENEDEMPLFKLLARKRAQEAANGGTPSKDETRQDDEPLHKLIEQPRAPVLPQSELNPHFTFDRFVVNSSNQMVYEAARAVAEHPASLYNPFLVYGGVGLGKTHILQAIAHACSRVGLRTLYIPSEVFTNDLIKAIRDRTTAMFREKYRRADVLLVDDIQFIGGKESTQEEFFHTFNALVNFNKQIVMASDRHPSELSTLEDRLRSRFVGGLVADIQQPELETRIAILEMWAKERNSEVTGDVIQMVAQRAPNSVRELEGVFNQIIAQIRLSGQVSMARAQTTVERFKQPRQHVKVPTVIQVVAEAQNLSVDELIGKRRTARINQARQIAMYLARDITDASLPQIGEAFGGRRHTTILHGCNRIAGDMAVDETLASRVHSLHRRIMGHKPSSS